jgi:hypothetical protein
MITIALANRPGGVFDYATKLGRALDSDCAPLQFIDTNTRFCSDSIFLQYSGYGFAKRGAPYWLLEKLNRDRNQIGILGIFFHELYAFAPPWSSAFWLSPAQRQIASSLVEICDYWVTNRNESAKWLSDHGGQGKLASVLPVFSTVGEPISMPIDRSRQIVVFGTPAVRSAAYLAATSKLLRFVADSGYTVRDIGDPIADPRVRNLFKTLKPTELGRLSERDVSYELLRSEYALLAYRPRYLAKSTIFAAYAAHGVPCLLAATEEKNEDDLLPGGHYVLGIPACALKAEQWQSISENALRWYKKHSLSYHAALVRELESKARAQ